MRAKTSPQDEFNEYDQFDGFDELDEVFADFARDPGAEAALEDVRELGRIVESLRAVRQVAGLKQKDVARAMGTVQSAVSDLERGRTDPQLLTLLRYARAVGVRVRLTAVLPRAEEERVTVSQWAGRADRGGLKLRSSTRAQRVVPTRAAPVVHLPLRSAS